MRTKPSLLPMSLAHATRQGWLHCGHRVCSVPPAEQEEGLAREVWQRRKREGGLEEMGRQGREGGGKGICVGGGGGRGWGEQGPWGKTVAQWPDYWCGRGMDIGRLVTSQRSTILLPTIVPSATVVASETAPSTKLLIRLRSDRCKGHNLFECIVCSNAPYHPYSTPSTPPFLTSPLPLISLVVPLSFFWLVTSERSRIASLQSPDCVF